MRFDTINHPVPWAVAESICQAVLRRSPSSIYVVGDPDGRIGYTIECLLADPETSWPCCYADALVDEISPGTDALIWVGDGVRGERESWDELAGLAQHCEGMVICAEPVDVGAGVGLQTLRRLDPSLLRIVTNEVPDGHGDNRDRDAWEEPMHWSVAQIAAWRFQNGAEAARRSFVSGLHEMNAVEIGEACERILTRWPSGHEVLGLALVAAAEQGHSGMASSLLARLKVCPGVSHAEVERLLRELKGFGCGFWRATADAEAQRFRSERPANSSDDGQASFN